MVGTDTPNKSSLKSYWKVNLRAYTRCVGIPMSIGAQLIAAGKVCGVGTVAPEAAFDPATVFAELEKRSIYVHEEVTEPGDG